MFSIRQIFSLRQMLAAAALAVASAGAMASADRVTAADLDRVEHAWQANPAQAAALLQELQTTLQETGHVDEIRTVSDVYWRHARATFDIDCKASYRSLYQATVLGFMEQWPQRAQQYQVLAYNLQRCLPSEVRVELGQQAWGVLRTSKLRDVVDITRVEKAGLNTVPWLSKTSTQAAPDSATDAPAQTDVAGVMKTILSCLALLALAACTMAVLFSIYRGALGPDEGSAVPPAPTKRTGRAAASQSTRKARSSRLQRARLVRMRPWG